jgi:hypothetical protein
MSFYSIKVVNLDTFSYELLIFSYKTRLYHDPSKDPFHFDLRDFHPPLGPTPVDKFILALVLGIVVAHLI